jgi:hypothetical protein
VMLLLRRDVSEDNVVRDVADASHVGSHATTATVAPFPTRPPDKPRTRRGQRSP